MTEKDQLMISYFSFMIVGGHVEKVDELMTWVCC